MVDSKLSSLSPIASIDDSEEVYAIKGGVEGRLSMSTLMNNSPALAERVRDVMGVALVNGANVTISVNDAGDTITIAAASSSSALGVTGCVVVASSEATATVKAGAHYTCDGTNDESEINSAIVLAAALVGRSGIAGDQRGTVQLTGGRFNISGSILNRTGVTLQGMGPLTELRAVSLSAVTGAGANPAILKMFDVNTHLVTIRNLWVHGNFASGGSTCYGIQCTSATSGDDQSAYPDTDPDCYITIEGLYMLGFTTGTRHAISITTDVRGVQLHNINIRQCSGNALDVSSSADSHASLIHVGTISGTGFNINGGNWKLNNCKAFYCDVAGFTFASSRCAGSTLESQDNVVGFNFNASQVTFGELIADTCQTDGIVINSSRVGIEGAQVFVRGSGRYGTMTNGIKFVGTPTGVRCLATVDPSNVTNPTTGTTSGARNFIRIDDGSTLISVG